MLSVPYYPLCRQRSLDRQAHVDMASARVRTSSLAATSHMVDVGHIPSTDDIALFLWPSNFLLGGMI